MKYQTNDLAKLKIVDRQHTLITMLHERALIEERYGQSGRWINLYGLSPEIGSAQTPLTSHTAAAIGD